MKRRRGLSNVQVIALGFLALIAAGTGLLSLPLAAAGRPATLLEAAFTATSASCVTGLVLVDTGTFWSPFGQAVVLVLIQLGGLGLMTIAAALALALRRKIGLRQRARLMDSVSTSDLGGVLGLTRLIAVGTAVCEGVGTVLLALRFVPQMGPRGLWYALFHSVSAFCNAGFDLMGGFRSLSAYAADPLVCLTVIALITVGGLGFLVWDDLLVRRFSLRRLRLQSKLVLAVSAVLTLGGAALLLVFERGATGAGHSLGEQALAALFGSVTARTAGFNTVDTAALSPGGMLTTAALMFVGGSPGSTAGGVKTVTVAVLLAFARSGARRSQQASLFGRSLRDDALRKAVAVLCFHATLALFGALVLTGEGLPLADALFESLSAIGTVGMSTGATRLLSGGGCATVMLLMFCGRVGSVSFALALLERRARPPVRAPFEDVAVG